MVTYVYKYIYIYNDSNTMGYCRFLILIKQVEVAPHCNTHATHTGHTATHCNTLQYTAARCNSLQDNTMTLHIDYSPDFWEMLPGAAAVSTARTDVGYGWWGGRLELASGALRARHDKGDARGGSAAGISHVTHMNESWHTYEGVVSHVWMSHVTHMNESCHTYEWVMSHICHTPMD